MEVIFSAMFFKKKKKTRLIFIEMAQRSGQYVLQLCNLKIYFDVNLIENIQIEYKNRVK